MSGFLTEISLMRRRTSGMEIIFSIPFTFRWENMRY